MMLRSETIAGLLEKHDSDPLVITPTPDLNALKEQGGAAVDLRLGRWFLSLRRAGVSFIRSAGQPAGARIAKESFVRFGSRYYLHPQAFVLGVTLEWIRVPRNLGGYVVGKSKWGRRGLIVATAVGVHPGFSGCLTLEITNAGEVPLELEPGMAIAQLFLHDARGDGGVGPPTTLACRRKPALVDISRDAMAEKLARNARYEPDDERG